MPAVVADRFSIAITINERIVFSRIELINILQHARDSLLMRWCARFNRHMYIAKNIGETINVRHKAR